MNTRTIILLKKRQSSWYTEELCMFLDCFLTYDIIRISFLNLHDQFHKYVWLQTLLWMREKCLNTDFFSGPYFSVFGQNTEIYRLNFVFSTNTGKYRPQKAPYLHTFQAMYVWYIWRYITFTFRFKSTMVFTRIYF